MLLYSVDLVQLNYTSNGLIMIKLLNEIFFPELQPGSVMILIRSIRTFFPI